MKRRARKQNRPCRQRTLGMERLESRVVLDGGVRAVLSGGALRIQGDARDNQIVVEQQSARIFTVSSRDGTTLINGQAGPVTIAKVTKGVQVTLGAGHDVAEVKGRGMQFERLTVDTGAGADRVLISALNALNLGINTGAQDDTVVVGGDTGGVTVKNDVRIVTGNGADRVRITGSVFKRALSLDLGSQNDEASLLNVNVAKKSTISGGAGADLVSREATRGQFKYAAFEQQQNSVAPSVPEVSGEGGIGILAVAVDDAAIVVEDALPNTAVGNVLANDPGGPGANFVTAVNGFAANVGASVPGQYGFFWISPDGTFTYILNNQNIQVNALNTGETLTDTITYTVSDGVSPATGTLTITIQGNTDTPPLAAVADAAVVIEDSIPNTAVGNVLANDTGGVAAKIVTAVNGFAANVGRSVTGQYGFFWISPDGTFTYILSNDNPVVNALNTGETLTDTVTYEVTDGVATTTGTLAITIQGNTDTGPLTAVDDAAVVFEDTIPNTSLGNVLLNDTGGVRAKVVTAVNGFAANVGTSVPGKYGSFRINPDGTFTYILRNELAAVNALNAGQSLTDSADYTASDGFATSIGTLVITIQGVNG